MESEKKVNVASGIASTIGPSFSILVTLGIFGACIFGAIGLLRSIFVKKYRKYWKTSFAFLAAGGGGLLFIRGAFSNFNK